MPLGRWIFAGGTTAVLALSILALSPSLAAAPSLALHSSWNAGTAQWVNSTFAGNITVTSAKVVNNVTYLIVTTLRSVSGNMTGTLLAYEWGSVQANGSMVVNGYGTFVGTVLGSSPGTFTMTWHHVTGVYGGSLSGTVFVSHGMRGLAGIHGHGPAAVQFTGGAGFAGSYSLRLF
jgi:hypothetical protein